MHKRIRYFPIVRYSDRHDCRMRKVEGDPITMPEFRGGGHGSPISLTLLLYLTTAQRNAYKNTYMETRQSCTTIRIRLRIRVHGNSLTLDIYNLVGGAKLDLNV